MVDIIKKSKISYKDTAYTNINPFRLSTVSKVYLYIEGNFLVHINKSTNLCSFMRERYFPG